MLSMLFAPEAVEEAKQAADAAAQAAPAVMDGPRLPPLETAHSWAMPTQASTFAEHTDNLYFFILALDLFFFVLVMGAMGYFMWKYRRRSKDQKTSSITHSGVLEFWWSFIPAILLLVIFFWSEIDFLRQAVSPQDALNVRVVGRKWFWTVEYPDYPGAKLTSSQDEPMLTMIVPKDRPVQLTMTSEDVIHSFYIPAFRVKRDAVPGRYTSMWFEATRVGEFNIFCTEYCGDWHSKMTGVLKVLESDQFETALAEAAKLEQETGETIQAFGARVAMRNGCTGCHSNDGTPGTGPTWKGLWGKSEALMDGSITVEGEDGMNYLRESILEPNAKIVSGYAGIGMPSYKGQLTDPQIDALIAYIKSLSEIAGM